MAALFSLRIELNHPDLALEVRQLFGIECVVSSPANIDICPYVSLHQRFEGLLLGPTKT